MKVFAKSLAAVAVCAALAPAALADGRNPGSVLVFPVARSGGFLTIVAVTNTNLTPETPVSLGGSTNLHYEYANAIQDPTNVFCPSDCIIIDRVEFLTPADTFSVMTACHNAVNPLGDQGYLVVSAENPTLFDTPWSHNYLIGSEVVFNQGGGMYSINALPFNAVAAAGAATDADNDGQLDFDGVEYEGIADELYIDSFIAVLNSRLTLINLTGGPHAKNTVLFRIWNDNEFPLSATLTFKCWFDQALSAVSPVFGAGYLAANTPDDPAELDLNCDGNGTIETGWAVIDSLLVQTLGGSVIDTDGAMLGAITAGFNPQLDGGKLLWESTDLQFNGQFVDFGGN